MTTQDSSTQHAAPAAACAQQKRLDAVTSSASNETPDTPKPRGDLSQDEAFKWWWAPANQTPSRWGTDPDHEWYGITAGFQEKILPKIPPGFDYGLWYGNLPIVRGSVRHSEAAKIDAPELRHRPIATFDGEILKITLYKHTDQLGITITPDQGIAFAHDLLGKCLEAKRKK